MTDLKDVRYVRSTSQQGLSIVTLQFEYGTDMRRALVDVQQLVQQAQADLPYDRANLKPSWVVPVDPLNTPVLQLAVSGVGWNLLQLRQLVQNDVVEQLKTVPGVQTVQPFGGVQRQLQVVADRNKLASYGLSLVDVKNALDSQNVSRSAGTITNATGETLVVGADRALTAADVRGYPLTTIDGRTVYVGDVATIVDGARERRSAYEFNGKEAVEVSVVETPNAN
jgi:HAE1 family hydrophobic/amphiphilic exporter-1